MPNLPSVLNAQRRLLLVLLLVFWCAPSALARNAYKVVGTLDGECASWFPDSKSLLYSRDSNVWRTSIGGVPPRKFIDGLMYPTLSRSGEFFAAVNANKRLEVHSLDGAKVFQCDGLVSSGVSWADGKLLDNWMTEVDCKEKIARRYRLSVPVEGIVWARYSPNGQRLAVMSDYGGAGAGAVLLFDGGKLVDGEGVAHPQAEPPYATGPSVWPPCVIGSVVYKMSSCQGVTRGVWDRAGDKMALELGSFYTSPSKGKAWVNDIILADAPGSHARYLGRGCCPSCSPAADEVAYWDYRGEHRGVVVVVDYAGRSLGELIDHEFELSSNKLYDPIVWSPDGRYVACSVATRRTHRKKILIIKVH